jgi:hypothetical protein
VRLTTLPPSVRRLSENAGASTSRNPKGLHGLYRDKFTFFLCIMPNYGIKVKRASKQFSTLCRDMLMQCFVIEIHCNTKILFDGNEVTKHLVADIEPSQEASGTSVLSHVVSCHAQHRRRRCKCDSGTFQIQILNIFICN